MNNIKNLVKTSEPLFCSGRGFRNSLKSVQDSDGKDASNDIAQVYEGISENEILEMVKSPQDVIKDKSLWFIPSTYRAADARNAAPQIAKGEFHSLVADIDSGNHDKTALVSAINQAIGEHGFVVYSTKSATEHEQRWRVLVFLKSPIVGVEYGSYQTAFFDALRNAGVECDRSMEKTSQLVLLPNRGEVYEYHIQDGEKLDVASVFTPATPQRPKAAMAGPHPATLSTSCQSVELNFVEELLDHIEVPQDYRQWSTVLMATHRSTCGSSDGRGLADRWSSKGKKYVAGEVEQRWGSYDPTIGYGISTLIRLAKNSGWSEQDTEFHEVYAQLQESYAQSSPEYPLDALGPLSSFAEAIAQETQAPLAIAAQSVIAGAALATQGFANVETLGGQNKPTSLFLLTIAKSGERKSTTDGYLKAAFDRHQQQALLDFREEMLAHEYLASAHERQMKKASDVSAVKSLLAESPPKPLNPIKTLSDFTIEGLYRQLEDGDPSIGVFSDEGGQILGGHSMNAENRLKTVASLASVWDGTPVQRVRAGTGQTSLYGRRVSMHIMVQPEIASQLTRNKDLIGQGFLPRFLMCHPTSTIGYRKLGTQTEASKLAVLAGQERLLEILRQTPDHEERDRQCLSPRTLPLSAGAMERLEAFFYQTETAQRPGEWLARMTGFASKICEQAARLAGVMTLWENLDAEEVTEEHMINGIVLAEYYLKSSSLILTTNAHRERKDQDATLYSWILNTWPQSRHAGREDKRYVMVQDICQYGPNAVRQDKGRATRVLEQLVQEGALERLEGENVDKKVREIAYRYLTEDRRITAWPLKVA